MQANITIIYMDSEISMGEAEGENAILYAWEEAQANIPGMYEDHKTDCSVSVVVDGVKREFSYYDALAILC